MLEAKTPKILVSSSGYTGSEFPILHEEVREDAPILIYKQNPVQIIGNISCSCTVNVNNLAKSSFHNISPFSPIYTTKVYIVGSFARSVFVNQVLDCLSRMIELVERVGKHGFFSVVV
jgi:hypothetical protein